MINFTLTMGSKEKKLVELFEAATKAGDAAVFGADGGAEESRCLDALKQLKNFPVNHHLLLSTQVGKNVRCFTKHPRKNIQVFATDLFFQWKQQVRAELTKTEPSDHKSSVKSEPANGKVAKSVATTRNLDTASSLKVEKTATKVSHNGAANKKLKVSHNGVTNKKLPNQVSKTLVAEKQEPPIPKKPPPEVPQRNKLNSMIKCNDNMRDKLRDTLFESFSRVATEADKEMQDQVTESDKEMQDQVKACDPILASVSVESVLFQKWGRSNGPNKAKYRSLMFNIKDPNNPDFRRKVLLGEVTPERLLTITATEMASDKRKEENENLKKKAMLKSELAANPEATTDQFKCSRCGLRKCTYHQLQTRGADEPMTTYVTCVNCNNKWKFC